MGQVSGVRETRGVSGVSGASVVSGWRRVYVIGMQKQRLFPSGSVTANSRNPQV